MNGKVNDIGPDKRRCGAEVECEREGKCKGGNLENYVEEARGIPDWHGEKQNL